MSFIEVGLKKTLESEERHPTRWLGVPAQQHDPKNEHEKNG